MLILSRRPGESLTIGDDVVVTVVGVSGNQIRLGITAPREVRVLREEVHKAMQEENKPLPMRLIPIGGPEVLLDSCGDENRESPATNHPRAERILCL
jgi:carbon storage regulator